MRWRKISVVLLIIAVFGSLLYYFRDYAKVDCGRVEQWIRDWGFWGPCYFCGLYVLATLGFMPGLLLSLVAGVAFGPLLGTALVTLGATIGSTIIFLLARYLLRDRVETMMASAAWFQNFKQKVAADGFHYMVFVRLVPLFPFGGINLASGVLPLSLAQYFFGSLLGMIPGSFAYVYLGKAGCDVVQPLLRGEWSLGSVPKDQIVAFGGALLLLIALSLLPLIVKHRRS